MRRIYLDHAATTPLDAPVFEAMLPYLRDSFGNASSLHALGRKARFAVEESRDKIAGLIGAEPSEIIFTSGGTESNNMAVRLTEKMAGCSLVTSTAEHEAVLRPAERFEKKGGRLVLLDPGPAGAPSIDRIAECLTDDVGLVSLMQGNNEVGSMTDVTSAARLCRERGIVMHTDAVQTAGYGLLRVDEIDVDLATVSAHKFYGPKGVGILFARGGVPIDSLIEGGAQERGRRGGTENVAAIVGMASAFGLAADHASERREHAAHLREHLRERLLDALEPRVIVNTPTASANILPHVLNIAFPPANGKALDGEMLLLNLDLEGVMASAGSACTSGAREPSHVLTAMGLDPATASATVRFSLGKDTTVEDVDYAVAAVERVVRRMTREASHPEFHGPAGRA